MNRTKKSLLMSIVSLLLCLSMLMGTTWAWFTDSVASTGNRIVSGSLKVDLLHYSDSNWVSLKENPEHKILNYDLWEPGHTRLEKLKVKNLGDLALKYQLNAEVLAGTEKTGKDGARLSDVIDVYLYNGDSSAESFVDIQLDSGWIKAGTLTEMLSASTFAGNSILPEGFAGDGISHVGEHTVSMAFHMRETAGNEYQDLYVGDIYITLVATQYTYESDSFGDQYDKLSIFPDVSINYSIKAPVTLNSDGTAAAAVSIGTNDDGVHASVAAGTKIVPGTSQLTLSVNELIRTNANIKVEDGQQSRSVDVHVSGIADDNTIPVIVTVNSLMPTGLNLGNFKLYHVEDGTPVEMTGVYGSELDAHNEYSYDPATGNVKMALATFSEVAVLASAPKWKGEIDVSWYTSNSAPDGTKDNPYIIASADQLAGFGAIVGGMATSNGIAICDDFSGKYVKLVVDIDLGTEEGHTQTIAREDDPNSSTALVFYPIGYYCNDGKYEKTGKEVSAWIKSFCGTFDGNGHTIKNFYQNTWEMKGDNTYYALTDQYYREGMGLFGRVYGGTVKNLTVSNFSSDGEFTTTGCIAAYADYGATFENIAITNCNPRVYNIGNGGIVGCVGWYTKDTTDKKVSFTNITVDQTNKISALWGSWDVACGGLVGTYYPESGQSSANYPKNPGITFENCHVAAQIDANNDVCANYQYYWYRYSGMIIGTVRNHVTDDKGYTRPDMTGISAENCTVHSVIGIIIITVSLLQTLLHPIPMSISSADL